MPEITIKPATKRDTSYVAAHMRQIDRDEIYCQMDKPCPLTLTYYHLTTSKRHAYNAFLKGKPVAAYGLCEPRPGLGELWAFGTDEIYPALRAITDQIRYEITPDVFADERVKRVECKSSFAHSQAHGWIESIGFRRSPHPLHNWGKNGEHFWLFELTREALGEKTYEQHLKEMEHVRRRSPSSTSAPTPARPTVAV